MARYIDASELLKKNMHGNTNPIVYRTYVENLIKNAPTVDATEVVQELWKKTVNEKPDSTRHLIVANGSLISHYGYYLKPKDKWYKTFECEEEIEVPAFWMDMPDPPKESIYGECPNPDCDPWDI